VKILAPNLTQLSSEKGNTASSVVTPFLVERKSRNPAVQAAINHSADSVYPAIDMLEFKSAIKHSPVINVSRIVGLHNRIAAGEYKIDPQRLAEKLIGLESVLNSL
jgi:anti-sigma28 factor (negative regulator of flagellin synthesis)